MDDTRRAAETVRYLALLQDLDGVTSGVSLLVDHWAPMVLAVAGAGAVSAFFSVTPAQLALI